MPDKNGRILKGERLSPSTEFKAGEHWRDEQPFWSRDWLYHEYVELKKSSGEIAAEFNVTNAAIVFWLRKHGIPRRTTSQARSVKHWGVSGVNNPMFGKIGELNHNWKGGITPERQALYGSFEWRLVTDTVLERDNHTCQRCAKVINLKKTRFHIHHIVPFAVVELRLELTNLVLLCHKCHAWVHSKKNVQREFIQTLSEWKEANTDGT